MFDLNVILCTAMNGQNLVNVLSQRNFINKLGFGMILLPVDLFENICFTPNV